MVDYNSFAKTFSNSRKNMKWEEIEYFLEFLKGKKNLRILDIGCGNGRLLGELLNNKIDIKDYLGIDLSNGLLDEARNIYPEYDFLELNMLNLNKISKKYDIIFFIASFHHIEKIQDRIEVIENAYKILEKSGYIFMTNWALDSNLNKKKYFSSLIKGSKNLYGSIDYMIKIGKFDRYYHCFSLDELNFIFSKIGFKILENRLFENDKNIVSILEK